MPRGFFEPENLKAMAEVLDEAKRHLPPQDLSDPTKIDGLALRILALATDGWPPWVILRKLGSQDERGRRFATQGVWDAESDKKAA